MSAVPGSYVCAASTPTLEALGEKVTAFFSLYDAHNAQKRAGLIAALQRTPA